MAMTFRLLTPLPRPVSPRLCQNIIISCLANDSSVEAVYEELLKATPTGRKTVFVETSTVYPELSSK